MITNLQNLFKSPQTIDTSIHTFKNVFAITAPSLLVRNDKYDMFQLIDPEDNFAAITASAYEKEGGSLTEFSEYRFGGVEKFYQPVSALQQIAAADNQNHVMEFEGTYPNETEPTYYVVSAIETGKLFISLTFVTERAHFQAHRDLYMAIISSVKALA